MNVPDSAPLHQVTCPHCGKINTTTARTQKRCAFCKKVFDPSSGAKTPTGKKSKYNACKVTNGSITFDSKAEEKWYFRLKCDPEVAEIEVHPAFEIFPSTRKCLACQERFLLPLTKCPKCGRKLEVFRAISYVADFKVTYKDGHVEIQDVKGIETEAFKLKRKLFEAAYPALTIRIVRVK